MKIAVFFILPLVFIAGCISQTGGNAGDSSVNENNGAGKQIVSFTTDDSWALTGDYYPSAGPPVILVHMLGRTRSDWRGFAERLNENNFTVLSFDMRGHGESLQSPDGERRYTSFSSRDWLGVLKDIKAAKTLLQNKGHDTSSLGIAGASIAANIALRYAVQDKDVKALALLSPGIEYRGVETPDIISLYQNSIIIVSSKDDRIAESGPQVLAASVIADATAKVYDGSRHGTDMFEGTDLQMLLTAWFRQKIV